jgi:hypothetical protein
MCLCILSCAEFYNDRALDLTRQAACLQCPAGRTTGDVESKLASDCDLCKPGYGNSNCATVCGGVGASATYGEGLRPLSTSCTACSPTILTANISGTSQNFSSTASSKTSASLPTDCLSTWAIFGQNWYLAEGDSASVTLVTVGSVAACWTACQGTTDCQFATYLPNTNHCRVRKRTASQFSG